MKFEGPGPWPCADFDALGPRRARAEEPAWLTGEPRGRGLLQRPSRLQLQRKSPSDDHFYLLDRTVLDFAGVKQARCRQPRPQQPRAAERPAADLRHPGGGKPGAWGPAGASRESAARRCALARAEASTCDTPGVSGESRLSEGRAAAQRCTTGTGKPSTGAEPRAPGATRFSWSESRGLMLDYVCSTSSFAYRGQRLKADWLEEPVPTLGVEFNDTVRCQKMFKTSLRGQTPVFLKCVPTAKFLEQLDAMDFWNGAWSAGGENYVAEAVILSFITHHKLPIAPKLIAVALDPPTGKITQAIVKNAFESKEIDETCTIWDKGCTVVITEAQGVDLLDYLDRWEHEHGQLDHSLKKELQYKCLDLLRMFHACGLAHLDFTPENILVTAVRTPDDRQRIDLRLCDFAKAMPLFRQGDHATDIAALGLRALAGRQADAAYPCSTIRACFESFAGFAHRPRPHPLDAPDSASGPALPRCRSHCPCIARGAMSPVFSVEPTVGKGPYMPPECWQIVHLFRLQAIESPVPHLVKQFCSSTSRDAQRLAGLTSALHRYSFSVELADIYMYGVLAFWIWTSGAVWQYSDAAADAQYAALLKSNMDFSVFKECGNWPECLNSLLRAALNPEPTLRSLASELAQHSWWKLAS